MRRPILICVSFVVSHLALAQELPTLKETTDRWIEIRSRLSKERADWETDKEILRNTIVTLESSKEAVLQNVAYFEGQSRTLSEGIVAAQERLEGLEKSNALLLSRIVEYEQRVRNLAKRFPEPLLDKLRPLLVKIPAENSATTLALPNRIQNAVAIMTLVDEFNNDLTLAHSIRKLENGEVIDVRVLYWGLATGYATNSDGTRAWILTPGTDRWEWREAAAEAPSINRLFDVYDKSIDPVLVNVPFRHLGKEEAL